MNPVRPERIRDLRTGQIGPDLPAGTSGPVIYWNVRERRVHDNWSLLYALHAARELTGDPANVRVMVVMPSSFMASGKRQYEFLLQGLEEMERDLCNLGIPVDVITGDPEEVVPLYIHQQQPALVVTDTDMLRIRRHWMDIVAQDTIAPLHDVDSHNVVPVWQASSKLEVGARTIRPKIVRQLATFLEPFPTVEAVGAPVQPTTDWQALRATLNVDPTVKVVDWIQPGERAAKDMMISFLARLDSYADRNDPTKRGQSNLSPYFHFGQIAPQRVALEALNAIGMSADEIDDIRPLAHGFLEELIIRRELADNFAWYNDHYDRFEGFPDWAQKTLNEHRGDQRDYEYHIEDWEAAETHDELWNAAQREMMVTGKMHGFMRMYWAKKILEWSHSPEEAIANAITLNDKYELDGRDPNGYAGIAWSIGGVHDRVHDRAWTERPVYGKIRYMNENGCRRKFDVDAYIAAHPPID